MPKIVINSVNLDANEAMFFARELEYIKTQTYDVLYPEYIIKNLIPVDSTAGPGAESVTYRQFDRVGTMKIMASYADDAPRSNVMGQEFTSKVKSIRGSYGYSLQDVRNSIFSNRPLKAMEAMAAREAYEQTVNDFGWFADGTATYGGLIGFLYNAYTTKSPAITGSWTTSATADQIIADIAFAINTPRTLTKKTEIVNTCLLPVDQYSHIASKTRSTTSDTTILEFIKSVFKTVEFIDCNELSALNPAPSGGTAPTDVMIAYRKDPTRLEFQIPQPFEQFPPQERNLEWVINTHARIGNVTIYKPLSVHVVEGI